ncbi:MAG: hypothetical protein AAF696_00675 [Bacteroidota bacterium]
MKKEGVKNIFNLGTAQARSFNDLGKAIFSSMGKAEKIEYFDTPKDIRNSYQYFTQAEMGKLRTLGYKNSFSSLEAGIMDYVQNFLQRKNYF